MARRRHVTPGIGFVLEGEERHVDLRAPRPIRMDGRLMVPLIDLWVASLLPGDLLDLSFAIVTSGPEGSARCSPSLEPLLFARGFIDVETRQLRWDDPAECAIHGQRAHTVVVSARAKATAQAPVMPPPDRSISVAELRRLLPHAVDSYPPVVLRTYPPSQGSGAVRVLVCPA
jgi:hypothetical protein